MKVAVGSTNPVKVNAAKSGTELALKVENVEVEGFNVPSDVSEQPFGDEETLRGATNRAMKAFSEYARKHNVPPSYSIGLEGGVGFTSSDERELECFAWMVVFDGKNFGKAKTGSFQLPEVVRNLVVNEHVELGVADDRVFGTSNSKQQGGSVGQLTKGAIDRALYYQHAVVLAYIPFLWKDLYFS